MNFYDIGELSEEEKEAFINEMSHIRSQLESHIIPEAYPEQISNILTLSLPIIKGHIELVRDNMVEISAYCLISKDWIRELVPMLQGKKCLEIMSGSGMLSKALQEEGISVIATDSKKWNFKSYWCEVEKLDANDAIDKYIKDMDYIICSWVPYASEAGTNALLAMRKLKPDCRMIYIGEMAGCCGTENFADICEIEDNAFIRNANRKFKQWGGLHDQIFILR